MKKELMKVCGLVLLLSVLLILFVYLILNWNPSSQESIASELIDQHSVLAIGADFDTGKSLAFDPLTEQEIKPCQQTITPTEDKYIREQRECKINKFEVDAPTAVLDAIKNNREIFEGFVMKDNKKIPTKFTIAVSALYEGSMCHTYWSGGDQLENCISAKQRCNNYVPNSPRINKVKGLRATCTKLGRQWPGRKIP